MSYQLINLQPQYQSNSPIKMSHDSCRCHVIDVCKHTGDGEMITIVSPALLLSWKPALCRKSLQTTRLSFLWLLFQRSSFDFKCLCQVSFWKAGMRILVDLACLEHINNRKPPQGCVVISVPMQHQVEVEHSWGSWMGGQKFQIWYLRRTHWCD